MFVPTGVLVPGSPRSTVTVPSGAGADVSVIIPTLALRERAALLRRAIDSVCGQQEASAVPLVVVNGKRFDRSLLAELESSSRLVVTRIDDANLPNALRVGRSMVRTRWFSSLDDDDVLLSGALSRRREALIAAPEADVVVTNGYRNDAMDDVLFQADMGAVARDPVGRLANGTWLLPGSWLARSDRVGVELFDGMPSYLECTFLAIQFSLRYRTIFRDEPTVRWHAATPGGEHLSAASLLAQPEALLQLLSMSLPSRLRRGLRRHLAAAHHAKANYYLQKGQIGHAWQQHMRTLAQPDGLRHWPLSVKILWRAVRWS